MVFGRVLTATISPFTPSGKLNVPEAERLAKYLADNGTDTLVVCGTTGESPTLTWDEEFELFKVMKQAVAGNAKVIAGTGSNSTEEAIAATRQAAALDLDGTLQVVPYYNKPTQTGLYEHFRAIAACSDLPVLLYNIPGRSGVSLHPETVAKLAQLPTVVGIKEASGSMDTVSAIRKLTPPEFAIYSGDDSLTLPMLALGASGVVSVASHLIGPQLQQMIQDFFAGRLELALKTHLRLFPLFEHLFVETNPTPVKTALQLQGWDVGSVRLPLAPLSPASLETLKSTLQQLDLLDLSTPSDPVYASC
ncbi:4-hydroxy-tetrahydrodipicolinate synthase [Synechococcus sp. PCC 7336]|uniref:4-hydroxy-tetrahydrodipicolinate synthase n=1 Tax=Synechococcus sp. PCC 7336 TaxID=195250 RepID=UPI0003497788